MMLARFWKALEVLGSTPSSLRDFQNRLGMDEHKLCQQFIRRIYDSRGTPLPIIGYPCERCGRTHTVVASDPDHIFAYLSDDEIECADISCLTLDDIQQRAFDLDALFSALANALSLDVATKRRTDGLHLLGTSRTTRTPFFLAINSSEAGYLRAARFLLADTRLPLVLLTLTHQPAVVLLFGKSGARAVALADVIHISPDGAFKSSSTAEEITNFGVARPQLPIKAAPLPLRGKRFILKEDFSAITDIRKKKAHPITALSCQEALRVLVECGSGTRATALHKREWCEAVWARLQSPDLWPQECKPIQFFRVRRKNKTIQVVFYRDVISTDGRGKYWLSL